MEEKPLKPPCDNCIVLIFCIKRLREDMLDEDLRERHRYDLSYTNIAMNTVQKCETLQNYLELRRPDWCVTLPYYTKDIENLCKYFHDKIETLRKEHEHGNPITITY